MGATPDRLTTEIDQTRDDLTSNVDALADKVSPARITRRRLHAVKSGAAGVKDKVMGSTQDAATGVSASAGQAAGNVAAAVSDAPDQLAQTARGNPLPAGLIAFGAGALIATLLPDTDTETRLAEAMNANGVDLVGVAKSTAGESAQRLKGTLTGPAQQALTSVKDTATDAVQTTKSTTQAAGGEVADHGQRAAKQVRGKAKSATRTTKATATTRRPGAATKRTSAPASRAKSNGGAKASDIHVVHKNGSWVVEQKGTGIVSTHRTQALAEQAGRRRARRDRTEFVLHGLNGRIREKDSYGNDPRGRG
jgi:hypothetical protein